MKNILLIFMVITFISCRTSHSTKDEIIQLAKTDSTHYYVVNKDNKTYILSSDYKIIKTFKITDSGTVTIDIISNIVLIFLIILCCYLIFKK